MADGAPSKPLHVIVAGFGPVGRFVTERLEETTAQVTIIETNARTVECQRRLGRRIMHGDATQAQVLRAAGVERADALVLAMPDEQVALAACRTARDLAPRVFIAARANFMSHGLMVSQAGADHVVIEEVVTAEAMQRAVMERLLGGMNGEGI